MTTSGTNNFSASAASALTLVAFGRIGIRRTAITAEHLADAAIEANLVQVTTGNNQPTLWKSVVFPITLVAGTAPYNLPATLIAIQDVYITTTLGGVSTDRVLYPLSLDQYDAQANKTQQAPPTSYVIKKIIPTPTITFWQTPDDSATYSANVRLLKQSEDVSFANGATLDMPYTYLDVFVAGLAHRLSRIYAPDKEVIRKQDYMEAWEAAARTDTQDSTSIFISPSFAGYWQ